MRALRAVDLFCGGGGTSTGLRRAAERVGRKLQLLAVNHWEVAVETHARNHPDADHLCESLDSIDPRKVVRGAVDLLVASPECTHHSIARGGKPMSDQSRASAWHVVRWAEALQPREILIENVREFATWGPLTVDGRPMVRRKGETFTAFLTALRSLGYSVEHRILNAANYGDPTTRKRLFIRASRARGGVRWPDQSHAASAQLQQDLFRRHRPWRTAREIIDWSIPGTSIFGRKRPLAPATMARIEAGLRKFGGAAAELFVLLLNRQKDQPRSVDQPLVTVTATSSDLALCEPFVLGQQSGGSPRPISQPLPTVATDGAISLVSPFIVPFRSDREGQAPRVHSADAPMPTLTAEIGHGVCQPFIMPVNHGGRDHRHYGLARPMPTVTSVDAWSLEQPFLVEYNGTGNCSPVSEPVPTVTGRDRFGLIVYDGYLIDIRFRMLQPRELARAQGFPDEYHFCGTREQVVRQIGNAVPVGIAEALCGEAVAHAA